MKILWFEISIPSKYQSDNRVLAGWQDALEEIVSGHNEIDLFVAFETSDKSAAPKFKNNVHYVPIVTSYSWLQRKKQVLISMKRFGIFCLKPYKS